MTQGSSQDNGNLYLILESTGSKSLLQMLYEQCEAPVWQFLLSETPWAPYRDESPVVIQTDRDSAFYQWALKELAKMGGLSGLIVESDGSLEAVLGWARSRLTVRFDEARKGLLRFYDPLIWHQLMPRDTGQDGVIQSVVYWYGSPEVGTWLASQNPEPVTMAEVPVLEPEQLRNLGLARV